jgi:hypothetical protein
LAAQQLYFVTLPEENLVVVLLYQVIYIIPGTAVMEIVGVVPVPAETV